MSLHTATVVLHVVAGVALVGHSLGTPLLLAAIRAAPTVAALRPLLGFARDSSRLNPVAAVVLLATGLGLASGRWDEGWIWVSLALWVASSALAVGVVKAIGERVGALAAAAGDGPVPPALDAVRSSRRWAAGAAALVASDLAALALMVIQPGTAGALVTAGAAAGAASAA